MTYQDKEIVSISATLAIIAPMIGLIISLIFQSIVPIMIGLVIWCICVIIIFSKR